MPRRLALMEALASQMAPGAPLIQFSYGMHAPVVPPPGHSVHCASRVWANLPPARVWIYKKI
jgi:phosphatidylethanolamine/phosphatidyl-N-methylethanolamine N-methyltransferase